MAHPDREELEKKLLSAKTKKEVELLLVDLNSCLTDDPSALHLLHIRATLYTKLERYGSAINDYRRILELDETDDAARQHLRHLETILRYSGNDIYANPNTNLDPWLE